MLNRRRMMMAAQGGGVLPSGYRECEYLESTGTQWIDTGVIPDTYSISYNIKITYNYSSSYTSVFGSRRSTASGIFGLRNTENLLRFFYDSSTPIYTSTSVGTKEIEFSDGNVKVNGILVKSYTQKSFNVGYPIRLFGMANANNGSVRIYYCSLKQIDASFNFIPALDPDGRPCMYDTISKQPFYNKGEGEFLYKLK